MKKEKFLLINFIILVIIILITLPFTLIIRTNIFNLYENNRKNNSWLVNEKLPINIPHGGAKETYPENTLYAYRKVKDYDAFEIDITLTKDLKLITHHNLDLYIPNLEKDDTKYFIGEYTYQEILDKLDELDYPLIREFNGKSRDKNVDFKKMSKEEIKEKGLAPVLLEEIIKEFPNKKYIIELKDIYNLSSRRDPFLKNPTIEEKNKYKEELVNGYIFENIKDNTTYYYRTDKYLEEFYHKAVDNLITLLEKYKLKENVLVASFDDTVLKYFNKKTNYQYNTMAGAKSVVMAKIMGYYNLFGFDIFKGTSSFSLPLSEPLEERQIEKSKSIQKFGKDLIYEKDQNNRYIFNLLPYGDHIKKDNKYYLAKKIVDGLHKLGKSVIVWTINEEKEMEYLIDLKVDGIITDDPILLDKVLKKYKEK